jgi:hypothetical protein
MSSGKEAWLKKFMGTRIKVSEAQVADAKSASSLPAHVISGYNHRLMKANERGVPFDLTVEQYYKLISQPRCDYTGIKFDDRNEDTKKTFERLDPYAGYSYGNILVVSSQANSSKSCLDAFEKGNLPDGLKIFLMEQTIERIRQRMLDNDEVCDDMVIVSSKDGKKRIVRK